MTRDEICTTIIRGLRDARARWWGVRFAPAEMRWREQRERWRLEKQRAAHGWYRYDPGSWLGRELTAHERRQFRAELVRMERNGLIELQVGRQRIVYVKRLGVLVEAGA